MIEFTNHAKRKIKQRNLKEAWILETLKNPDFVFPSYKNREIAFKKIGKLYLAVIFTKEGQNVLILTAHWEKSFKPERRKSHENILRS